MPDAHAVTEPESGLPRIAQLIGAIVAPTTVVTGLLFYFGFMHAYWFFDYFGVNSTVLGLSSVDYVMRSADALFVPMTVLACLALLALRAHLSLGATPPTGPRTRWILPSLAATGLLLATAGLLSVFAATPLDRQVALAPFCLGGGALLALYALRIGRPSARPWVAAAEGSGVFVLVALALFWAATDYSAAVGRAQARRYATGLAAQPDVVLYSERSLRLAAPGVRETRCDGEEAAYRYRYSGLKLVLQSGDQFLLLPAGWTRSGGVAFIVPRSGALRLEFRPAPALPPAC